MIVQHFRKLDDFVIDRVAQPIADWIASRTGWSNFTVARQTRMAATATHILWSSLTMLLIAGLNPIYPMASLFIAMGTMDQNRTSTQTERLLRSMPGTMNTLRVTHRLFRLFVSVLVPIILLAARRVYNEDQPGPFPQMLMMLMIWTVLSGIALYFDACTPTPPKKATAPKAPALVPHGAA